MTFLPANTRSLFLPTSQVYPEDESQRLIVLTDVYTQIAMRVNQKYVGLFPLDEIQNGAQFFNSASPRNVRFGFRKVFEIGAIVAGATDTTAHGITGFSTLTFTSITGTAVTAAATFNKIPLPYTSATLITDQVQLDVDDTNIRIINGATASDIASGIVILEYLKE